MCTTAAIPWKNKKCVLRVLCLKRWIDAKAEGHPPNRASAWNLISGMRRT